MAKGTFSKRRAHHHKVCLKSSVLPLRGFSGEQNVYLAVSLGPERMDWKGSELDCVEEEVRLGHGSSGTRNSPSELSWIEPRLLGLYTPACTSGGYGHTGRGVNI